MPHYDKAPKDAPAMVKELIKTVHTDLAEAEVTVAVLSALATDHDNFAMHAFAGKALMARVGRNVAGRSLDGIEHSAFPEGVAA